MARINARRNNSDSLAMFTTIVLNERPLARHGGALPGAALGLCVRRDRAAHIMQKRSCRPVNEAHIYGSGSVAWRCSPRSVAPHRAMGQGMALQSSKAVGGV
jgi:hypothetical protein